MSEDQDRFAMRAVHVLITVGIVLLVVIGVGNAAFGFVSVANNDADRAGSAFFAAVGSLLLAGAVWLGRRRARSH